VTTTRPAAGDGGEFTPAQSALVRIWEEHVEHEFAHEHIYWDQASVLVQLGLLDPGTLPVAGAESARKVLEPTLPSNALVERADRREA
jgi:hypothetical protein